MFPARLTFHVSAVVGFVTEFKVSVEVKSQFEVRVQFKLGFGSCSI